MFLINSKIFTLIFIYVIIAMRWSMENRFQGLFQIVENNKDKYVDFLCDICAFEARAYDKETIDQMVDFISEFAKKDSFKVTRKKMDKCGDFLIIDLNEGKQKACVFMAHMDTVHQKGAFGMPAVRREGGRIHAPGAIDCKGGIAVALLAMKSLYDNGFDKHVRLILTSDEEVSLELGGEEEVKFFEQSALGFPYVINCETTVNDQVVVSRKGILTYQLDIKGVGGHSGARYFACKNAILEAAHKIVALHQKSVVGGTTYSCNVINGGNVSNVIPDACTVIVDVRVAKMQDVEKAKSQVYEIANKKFVEGTSCSIKILNQRPPMEKNEQTQKLFEKLNKVCLDNDLGKLTPIESGGGSDAAFTQLAGIPTICGLGASGDFFHTVNEYVDIDTIPLRAKILSAFCYYE